MNGLTVVNRNGQFVADSREVAEMTDKRHDNLVRDIDGYAAILGHSSDLRADDFFIADTYQAGTGKEYRHYWLTRKGCDMVANKMTGTKGVLFTATYVTKFEEMEKTLQAPFGMLERLMERFMDMLDRYDKRMDRIESYISSIQLQPQLPAKQTLQLPSIPKETWDDLLTPTAIGKQLDMKAADINRLMARLGLQIKGVTDDGQSLWGLTDQGRMYGVTQCWQHRDYQSITCYQTRWRPSVIKLLKKQIQGATGAISSTQPTLTERSILK